ncbi:MAG: metal ABC transporter permease [Gammaproteobacteria bacterium]|jgi:zinc transport system permease protein
MNIFDAIASQPFLQYALLAGVLSGVGCGLMGTYVVVKRINFLAGGIAHSVLAGMGLAYFFGGSPVFGAIISAIVAALIIGWIKLRWQEDEDTIIAAVWSIGMAIGIIFIAKTPGYSVDLMSYLFGNILMVSSDELYIMLGLDIILLAAVSVFYKHFLIVCFDEEFAKLRGVNVDLFYLLLLCLVALTVVLLIQVVGLILVIALLTLPAAIAMQYQHSLKGIMMLAMVLGILFSCAGLIVSYEPDLPAGATIILIAGVCYIISSLINRSRKRRKFAGHPKEV